MPNPTSDSVTPQTRYRDLDNQVPPLQNKTLSVAFAIPSHRDELFALDLPYFDPAINCVYRHFYLDIVGYSSQEPKGAGQEGSIENKGGLEK